MVCYLQNSIYTTPMYLKQMIKKLCFLFFLKINELLGLLIEVLPPFF